MEGIGEELSKRLNEGRRKESEEEFWGKKKQQRARMQMTLPSLCLILKIEEPLSRNCTEYSFRSAWLLFEIREWGQLSLCRKTSGLCKVGMRNGTEMEQSIKADWLAPA